MLGNNVTIFMPVSRPDYLRAVFASLELLECDAVHTNILVVVDGGPDLFVQARNYTEQSKFAQRLCVSFTTKTQFKQYDVLTRRKRIAEIHEFAKQHLWKSDFIFGVEDDTLVPANTLKRLFNDFSVYPYAGFIEGVELGRWGVPHVGGWKVDDVYEPTKITSVMPGKGITELDAGGFYCYMTRFEHWEKHTFKPFDNNGLGPDVDYGIELRRLGMLNYIDWTIHATHRTKERDITPTNTDIRSVSLSKTKGVWRQGL